MSLIEDCLCHIVASQAEDAVVSKLRVIIDVGMEIHKGTKFLEVEDLLRGVIIGPDPKKWQVCQIHPVAFKDNALILPIILFD
jgi:hypothetical protein